MNRLKDMTRLRFWRLTVLRRVPSLSTSKAARWLCRCDCGKEKGINGNSLRRGLSESCGCLQREITIARNFKHGLHGTPEHNSWKHMLRRCNDPNSNRYALYGGMGITVCERWASDFRLFLADMGPKPVPSFTIDRFPDNNGNYEPGNCRWADSLTQQRNRRNCVILECDGDRRTMAEWAEVAGMNIQTLWARISRGWPIKKAIFFPIRLNKVIRYSR